jgi:ubiquinone/menaquinone biosynthesis C-methylase UbiE
VFDIVVDRGSLTQNTHAHVATVLEETWRVLKPGGVMMASSLFGMNYPDRCHGEEVSYHTFDHFRAGYFRSVGLTSFFTRDDLVSLFGRFGAAEIERLTVHGDDERILNEEFSVRATKQGTAEW